MGVPAAARLAGLVGWGRDGDGVGAAGSGEDGQGLPATTTPKLKNGTSMSSADHRAAGPPAAALPAPCSRCPSDLPLPSGVGHPWVCSCRAEPPWGRPGQPGRLVCGGAAACAGAQEKAPPLWAAAGRASATRSAASAPPLRLPPQSPATGTHRRVFPAPGLLRALANRGAPGTQG